MKPSRRVERVLIRRFPELMVKVRGLQSEGESRTNEAKRFDLIRKRSVNWSALVDRWIEGLELKPCSAMALTGFGDGRHVEALMSRLPHGSYVFCAQESVREFLAALENDTALKLLDDPRLLIGLGELDHEFFESLSRIPILEIRDATPLIFGPIFNESVEYYSSFLTEFARNFEFWRKLYGTNVTASGIWQRHTILNLPILIGAPDVNRLRDCFQSQTIILVSAGPSLDESLDFVTRNQRRCVIVAVNSSYRALRNAGVVPHFVLAADPNVFTAKGFEGTLCDTTILLCPFFVYPEVVKRFEGRIFTWSKNNTLATYLRLKIGLEAGSEVLEMGTVSACIFDIAQILGCQRVILVGQDLAAKSDGQLHATDSFYTDLNANNIGARPFRELPGNVIDNVRVEEKLFVYLKVFEAHAKKHASKLELWNASHLGARIKGVPYVPREEIERRLTISKQGKPCVGLEEVERILSPLSDHSERLQEEIETLARFADEILELSLNGAALIEEVSRGDSNQCADRLLAAESFKSDMLALLSSEPDLNMILMDGALKYELMLHARERSRIQEIENADQRKLEELRTWFRAYSNGVHALLDALWSSELVRPSA